MAQFFKNGFNFEITDKWSPEPSSAMSLLCICTSYQNRLDNAESGFHYIYLKLHGITQFLAAGMALNSYPVVVLNFVNLHFPPSSFSLFCYLNIWISITYTRKPFAIAVTIKLNVTYFVLFNGSIPNSNRLVPCSYHLSLVVLSAIFKLKSSTEENTIELI